MELEEKVWQVWHEDIYGNGLPFGDPLELYTREDAERILAPIQERQRKRYKHHQEFYLKNIQTEYKTDELITIKEE